MLVGVSEIFGVVGEIFEIFDNVDMVFLVVKNVKGEEVEFIYGNFIFFMEFSDRMVWKEVY